jgi:hypothetical protein
VQATGLVGGNLVLNGPAGAPRLEGDVHLADGTVRWLRHRLALTGIDLTMALRPGEPPGPGRPPATRAQIESFRGQLDQTTVTLTGGGVLPEVSAAGIRQAALDVVVRAEAAEQVLPHGTVLVQPKLLVNLKRSAGEDQALHVEVEQGQAQLGAGAVTLSGTADVTRGALADLMRNTMDLRLVLDEARVRYRPYLNGVVRTAPALRLWTAAPGEQARVTGRFIVSDGELGFGRRPPEPIGPRTRQWLGGPPSWPSPSLALTVDVGRGVAVRAPGLRLPLRPLTRAAVVTGTPQMPRLLVDAEARRGGLETAAGPVTIHFATLQYRFGPTGEVQEGRYVLAQLPDSEVSARGTSRLGEYEIEMRVSGSPTNPEITLTSTPPLSEDEIIQLFFGGTVPSLATGPGRNEQVLELLATGVYPRLESRILSPLAEAIIGTGAVDTITLQGVLLGAPTIEVGKFFCDDLYATFRHTFTAEPQVGVPDQFEFRLSYRVRDRYQVSFSTDEESNDRFLIGYRTRF